jgi:hypothetical protein
MGDQDQSEIEMSETNDAAKADIDVGPVQMLMMLAAIRRADELQGQQSPDEPEISRRQALVAALTELTADMNLCLDILAKAKVV